MLRTKVFVAALVVAWGWSCTIWAQEKSAYRGALPPTVAETLREAKIEAILRQPCSLDIDESSLQDACDYINQKHDIDVRLDAKALADAAIDASVLVTFHSKDLPLGSALDLILEDLDLTYILQHGVLKITSKEKADGILTMRVYPVEDLVDSTQAISGPRQKSSYDALIRLIEDSIAPDNWTVHSGIGSIKPFRLPSGAAIVVSNTRRVQTEVATLIADLRAAKQAENVAQDPTEPYTAMYSIGADYGPEMVTALTSAVAPDSWKESGGIGVVVPVPVDVTPLVSAVAGEGPKNAPLDLKTKHVKQWKLVVLQTPEVHRKIAALLFPPQQPEALSDARKAREATGVSGFPAPGAK